MSTTTTPRRKGAGAIVFVIAAVLLALILVSTLAPLTWKVGDTESAAAGPTVRSMSHGIEDEIVGDVSTGDKVRVHELTVVLPDGGTETWEVTGATWGSCSVGDTATRDVSTGAVTCE